MGLRVADVQPESVSALEDRIAIEVKERVGAVKDIEWMLPRESATEAGQPVETEGPVSP